MLMVDVRKRLNINQILKQQIVSRRIKTFLNEDVFKQEFSHTILHNQNVMFKRSLINQQKVVSPAEIPKAIPSVSPRIGANKPP
jgi:hypothetical protein